MGARFKVRSEVSSWRADNYAIDIRRDGRGQFFELRVPRSLEDSLDVTVLQAEPKGRHLLLLIRRTDGERRKDRFLCGHDEREWFVAAVPGGASSVNQAREALKPQEVIAAQSHSALTVRQRNSRNNRAFRRQGEWFFVPAPDLVVDPKHVLFNEPIRRGSGKSHWLEQAYRYGGTKAYVCTKYPNGITEPEYQKLLRDNPARSKWGWRVMQRDPGVYAKGTVRHPDHRTIVLSFWHRVLMNTEAEAPSMPRMAFLD